MPPAAPTAGTPAVAPGSPIPTFTAGSARATCPATGDEFQRRIVHLSQDIARCLTVDRQSHQHQRRLARIRTHDRGERLDGGTRSPRLAGPAVLTVGPVLRITPASILRARGAALTPV